MIFLKCTQGLRHENASGENDEKSFSDKGRYVHSLLNNNNNDKFLLVLDEFLVFFFFL